MKKTVMMLLLTVWAVLTYAQEKKILFVMSAARELPLRNGKVYGQTGVFLSEFYLAYKTLDALGYQVDFATPGGIPSTIDQESYRPRYWKGNENLIEEARTFVAGDVRYNHPFTLEQALAGHQQYAGLVIPGGQGLMADLLRDPLTPDLLRAFGLAGKCVGLICHAPALLLAMPRDSNPFSGYQVNSVTRLEEFFIENFVMKGKPYTRKIGKQLRRAGYVYVKAAPGRNFAVRDRLLVTSQNPFSHEAFGRLYTEALRMYEAQGRVE